MEEPPGKRQKLEEKEERTEEGNAPGVNQTEASAAGQTQPTAAGAASTAADPSAPAQPQPSSSPSDAMDQSSSTGVAASTSTAPSTTAAPSPVPSPSPSASPSLSPITTPSISVPLSNVVPPAWVRSLPTLLDAVEEHEPTIPDEIVQYLLERSGCKCNDPKIYRLVSLATQQFLYEVLHDARLFQKLRSKEAAALAKLQGSSSGTGTSTSSTAAGGSSQRSKDASSSSELHFADLSSALSLHGMPLAKASYIADSVHAGTNIGRTPATGSTIVSTLGQTTSQGSKGTEKKGGKK